MLRFLAAGGFLLWLCCFASGVHAEEDAVERNPEKAAALLKEGDAKFIAGQPTAALGLYTEAVQLNPDSHVGYYKRASAYIALIRLKEAVADFDTVLKLHPTHLQSYIRRGKAHFQLGHLASAESDLAHALELKPDDVMANKLMQELRVAKDRPSLDDLEHALQRGQYATVVAATSEIIHTLTESVPHRLLRARANLAQGHFNPVVEDTTAILKQVPSNRAALLVRARAFLGLQEVEAAAKMLRECLHYDMDDKECISLTKKLSKYRKLSKKAHDSFSAGAYADCVQHSRAALELEYQPLPPVTLHTLVCRAGAASQDATCLDSCNTALAASPDDVDLLVARGDIKRSQQEYEAAMADFNNALRHQRNNNAIRQRLMETERELKISKRKDYYKILGVDRSTPPRIIKKVYRRLALEWHPDKHGPEDRERVQMQFREITEAYEVLSDNEKRERYDRGDDLEDPPQQQGHPFGFNPFGGGGGGGGGFHFHF